MDNIEAAQILRTHRVDSSFDGRQPVVILESMVERGHLPPQVLGSSVEVVEVPHDSEN